MILQPAEPSPNPNDSYCLGLTIESQVLGVAIDSGLYEADDLVNASGPWSKRKLHERERDEDVRKPPNHDHKDRGLSDVQFNVPGAVNSQTRFQASQRARRSVRFACAEDTSSSTTGLSADDWPNFCDQSNFCTHVGDIVTRGFTVGHPLGYLHSRENAKHLIYLSSRTDLVSTGSSTVSMKSLNKLCINEELSTATVVSLSKQLSVAVLQYNATPWLEQWGADHVLVSAITTGSTHFETNHFESYLDVSIGSPKQDADTVELRETFVPNMTLFRLGVMLLELAYRRPLRAMQEPVDQRANEHDTAFATARRLRWRVSEKMGPEFASIVGKCIQCDLGHGQDLKLRLLQESYYENVVRGLADLEMRLKRLGI